MQDLTLGVIGAGLVFIVGLIAAIKSIRSSLKDGVTELLDDKFDNIDTQFEGINKKIDKLEEKLDVVEMGSCKNYIVPYLEDMDRGGIPDEIERQRFWDAYAIYVKDGGNSYIQDRVAKLQREGKL